MKCKKCGYEINPGNNICPNCGSELNNERKNLILFIIIIICIIFCIMSITTMILISMISDKIIDNTMNSADDKIECFNNGGYIDTTGKCVFGSTDTDDGSKDEDNVVVVGNIGKTFTYGGYNWYVISETDEMVKAMKVTTINDVAGLTFYENANCYYNSDDDFDFQGCWGEDYECSYFKYEGSPIEKMLEDFGKKINLSENEKIDILRDQDLENLGSEDERKKFSYMFDDKLNKSEGLGVLVYGNRSAGFVVNGMSAGNCNNSFYIKPVITISKSKVNY